MKATELTWMTAMSSASVVVPSPATTTFRKKAKAANSRNQLRPDGNPPTYGCPPRSGARGRASTMSLELAHRRLLSASTNPNFA